MEQEWQETKKKAETFYSVFVTREEIWNCGENEGKKIILEIGNQYEEDAGGACIDFVTDQEMNWIKPETRTKIIMCKETAQSLIQNLTMAIQMAE